jgi:hypothetical protein
MMRELACLIAAVEERLRRRAVVNIIIVVFCVSVVTKFGVRKAMVTLNKERRADADGRERMRYV